MSIAVAVGALLAASVATQDRSSSTDLESYRNVVERIFLRDRGGTIAGYAACVMCHTWQTSVRFSLETPATDAGWSAEQSRRNFDVVTKLINTADPESSRLLRKPLNPAAGGAGHTGGTYWTSRERSGIRRAPAMDSQSAEQLCPRARAGARFRVLPRVRAAGFLDGARRAHPLQQLPRERHDRLRPRRAGEQQLVRPGGEAGVSGAYEVDRCRKSRAEPLSAEAAASRRRRVLHPQRATPLAIARRP